LLQTLVRSLVEQTVENPAQEFSVDYNSQHFECAGCSYTNYSLNAPKFIFSSDLGVSSFYLPPLSGAELSSLALFFSTSASFPYSVVFDHIDGFAVIASAYKDHLVNLEFKADPKILHFMGINDSSNSLQVSLNYVQLDELAESILDSASNCK
jgi:hypothetical protein